MSDPKRLIISEDNDLGVALAAARRQLPSGNKLAELAERLAQHGAVLPPGTVAPAYAPSARPSGFRLGLKLKVGIGIAVLGGLGGLGAWDRAHVASVSQVPSAPVHVAVAASRELTPNAAVRSLEAAPAGPAGAHRDRVRSNVKPESEPSVSEPAELGPAAAAPVANAAPKHAEPAPGLSAPSASLRSPARSLAKTSAAPDVYETPNGDELPQSELELLKQARNAVTSDPLRAYALTERSRALFPQAALAQERDLIAITALFRMGREQQARSQAQLFRSRYPRSAYLPQIARMLENE